MKRAISDHLTPEQRAEIEALAALPEEKIKTDDIPDQRDWSGARRGVFFRPIKQQITLRIDADLERLVFMTTYHRRRRTSLSDFSMYIRALREYVALAITTVLGAARPFQSMMTAGRSLM